MALVNSDAGVIPLNRQWSKKDHSGSACIYSSNYLPQCITEMLAGNEGNTDTSLLCLVTFQYLSCFVTDESVSVTLTLKTIKYQKLSSCKRRFELNQLQAVSTPLRFYFKSRSFPTFTLNVHTTEEFGNAPKDKSFFHQVTSLCGSAYLAVTQEPLSLRYYSVISLGSS